MSKKALIPPLTFRLYQSIKFNRPVDKDNDVITPGGYELVVKDEAGDERTIQFDFEDFEGSIDKDNPCKVNCMQKNPDSNTFEDLNMVTEHMLRNIVRAEEWFIYTGEPGEVENPLIPVEISNVMFEIISDSTGADIPVMQIPVTTKIKPDKSVE